MNSLSSANLPRGKTPPVYVRSVRNDPTYYVKLGDGKAQLMTERRGSIRSMPIFRHRITGPGPAGDIWTTGLYSDGSASLSTAHTAWTTFCDSFFVGTMEALWSTEIQATELITDQLDNSGRHNVAQDRTSISYKGTGAGNALSQRTAVVCGLRTALPTRAGRGRMYVPAPDDSHLTTTGLLATADASTIASGLGTALNTMSGTVQVVIFHRASGDTTPVTSVTVGQVLGTQRRRTNKVSPNYQTADL